MPTIYERIKEVSDKRKMSIDYVNDKAGLSNKAIYGWKKSTPKADNLQKVADVLHVSTDYLLGRTDEMDLPSSNNITNQPQLRRIARRSDVMNAANDMIDLDDQEMNLLSDMITTLLKNKKK